MDAPPDLVQPLDVQHFRGPKGRRGLKFRVSTSTPFHHSKIALRNAPVFCTSPPWPYEELHALGCKDPPQVD